MGIQKNLEDRLRQLLKAYYELIDSDTSQEHECKGRINGFCEALIQSGQTDPETIQNIFNREHLDHFGMTREARYYQVVGSEEMWGQRDWEKFDRPTYARRPLPCKKK